MPQWSSIENLSFNSSSLSITSILFNPSRTASKWVERYMGSKAYHTEKIYGYYDYNNIHTIPNLFDVVDEYRNQSLMPNSFDLWPECSIEILGFVRADIEHPVMRNKVGPIVGTATLDAEVHGSWRTWKCYYRATGGYYNNDDAKHLDIFHYPVLFYCVPPPVEYVCYRYLGAAKHNNNIPFQLHMKLSKTILFSFVLQAILQTKVTREFEGYRKKYGMEFTRLLLKAVLFGFSIRKWSTNELIFVFYLWENSLQTLCKIVDTRL
jgi:hypothetical protein